MQNSDDEENCRPRHNPIQALFLFYIRGHSVLFGLPGVGFQVASKALLWRGLNLCLLRLLTLPIHHPSMVYLTLAPCNMLKI